MEGGDSEFANFTVLTLKALGGGGGGGGGGVWGGGVGGACNQNCFGNKQ